VVAALAAMLAPDGVLFLGPSESLWPVVGDLRAVDLGDCFCYRREPTGGRDGAAEPSPAPPAPAQGRAGSRRLPPSTPAVASRSAADGVRTEVQAADPAAARTEVLEALASNRLEAARERVDHARARLPDDPVLRLLEGLIHDVAAAPEAAIRSYRAALYLDPELAQARFLLARALERSGRDGPARREYRSLLATLAGGRGTWVAGGDRVGLPSAAQIEPACRRALDRRPGAPAGEAEARE
jgi:chemotaxis protein methyltransferase WspC